MMTDQDSVKGVTFDADVTEIEPVIEPKCPKIDPKPKGETFVLTCHSRSDFETDLVLNPSLFPHIKVNDFVEIFNPDSPKRKLLLQVTSMNESRGNIQVSVLKSITTNPAFQLQTFQPVTIRKAKESRYALAYIEMSFKDQYVSQGEFWRLKEKLLGKSCFIGQKISVCGINLNVDEMLAKGRKPMACGIIEPVTKFIFRSLSARLFWLVQLSKEMWNFAEDGELYFERFINRFCTEVFEKWSLKGVSHRLTVVFFARTYFNGVPTSDVQAVNVDYDGRFYNDLYHTVVENETQTDWMSLKVILKKSFLEFPKIAGWTLPRGNGDVECCGMPSTALEGNCLEAINLCLNIFDKHFMDRDIYRTGQAMVLVTAGPGCFEVGRELTKVTKQRMMDNAIGCDFVSLSRAPLHVAPLFVYKVSRNGNDVLDRDHPFAPKSMYRVKSCEVFSKEDDSHYNATDLTNQTVLPVYNIPHWVHLSFPYHKRSDRNTEPLAELEVHQDTLSSLLTPGGQEFLVANSVFWKAHLSSVACYTTGELFEPVPYSRMFDLSEPSRSSVPLALMHFQNFPDDIAFQDKERDNEYHRIPSRRTVHPWYPLVKLSTTPSELATTVLFPVNPGSPTIQAIKKEGTGMQPMARSQSSSKRSSSFEMKDKIRNSPVITGSSMRPQLPSFSLNAMPHSKSSAFISSVPSLAEFQHQRPQLQDRVNDYLDEQRLLDMNAFRKPLKQITSSFRRTGFHRPSSSVLHHSGNSFSYRSSDSFEKSCEFENPKKRSEKKSGSNDAKNDGSIMKFLQEKQEFRVRLSCSNLKQVIETGENRVMYPSDRKNLFGPGIRVNCIADACKEVEPENKKVETKIEEASRNSTFSRLLPLSRQTSEASSIGSPPSSGLIRSSAALPSLINPFDMSEFTSTLYQKKLTHNRRRWSHLFPSGRFVDDGHGIRVEDFESDSGGESEEDEDEVVPLTIESFRLNWKSIISPGVLPLTTDYYPEPSDLDANYRENFYSLTLPESPRDFGYVDQHEFIRELVCQRLSQDFQLYMYVSQDDEVTESKEIHSDQAVETLQDMEIAPSAPVEEALPLGKSSLWRRSNTITIKPASKGNGQKERSRRPIMKIRAHQFKVSPPVTVRTKYLLTMGHEIHELDFTPETREVKIKRFVHNNFAPGSGQGWEYSYLLFDQIEKVKSEVKAYFSDVADFYNWNRLDYMICGYHEDFVNTIRYRRMMFSILPGAKVSGVKSNDLTSPVPEKHKGFYDDWNIDTLDPEEEGRYINGFRKFVEWIESKIHTDSKLDIKIHRDAKSQSGTAYARVEIQSRNIGRYEWLLLQYDSNYSPFQSFHIEVQWMISAGSSIQTFVSAMSRKAKQCGLNFQQMPEYCRTSATNFQGRVPHPFVLPKNIYFEIPFSKLSLFYDILIGALQSHLGYVLDTIFTARRKKRVSWPILVHNEAFAFLHLSDISVEFIQNKLLGSNSLQRSLVLFGETRDLCQTVEIVYSLVCDIVDEFLQ